MNKLNFFILSLLILLLLNSFFLDQRIQVSGIVSQYNGDFLNQKMRYSNPNFERIFVLVAEGKVERNRNSSEMYLEEINNKYHIKSINSNGEFEIKIKPGLYTFFLLKDGKIYLNSFDGLGFYKSNYIESGIDDIIIIDDRNLLY